MAAVVLLSVSGCTGMGSAPAQADDPPAEGETAAGAPDAASGSATPEPARPGSGGALEVPEPAAGGDTGLTQSQPAQTQPAQSQPAQSQPAQSKPAQSQPAQSQPPLVRLRKLDLDRVREGVQLVPLTRVSDLPDRLAQLERSGARKRLFIKTMLPAVLHANEAIRAERDFVETLTALEISPDELPAELRDKLRALAAKYQVDPANLDRLRHRVDIVPPALVLAQAAIETGWGTSRFAQQGNAIFGQHTRDPDDAGMVPRGLENPSFRVRAFETVTGAVAAYLRNLNTHPAYAELRRIRAEARARGDQPDGPEMAAGLVDYSARGHDYVADIRLTIRANDLQAFAEARLQPGSDQLVDAGSFAEE
jgi:Bax protein